MILRISCLLLTVWFCCRSCWCLPPRLNVTKEFVVDVRENHILAIRCEGTQELHWNWTSMIDLGDSVLSITNRHHPATDFPFVSILTIGDPWIEDTGFYRCHYEGVDDYVTDDDNVASTYAYVFDGKFGLVFSGFVSMQVTTAEKLVLECRPTKPDIKVTLQKDSLKISQDRYQWDPRIGFVFRNIAVHDSGHYTCSPEEYEGSRQFFVQVLPRQSKIPKPNIEWGPNQHFVVGYSFQINCSILTDKRITFHWTPPDLLSNYTTIGPSVITRKESQYKVSTLLMYNATPEDSGVYKCQVSTSGMESSEDDRRITVKDSLDHYVNITSISVIPIMEGEFFKWKAGIHAFPPDPEIIYRNWKGKEVEESNRVKSEHFISSAESWLKIKNITAKEFGNYTMEAMLPDGSARSSFTVLVEVGSKPYPSILGVPSFVSEGQELEAFCTTTGFPIGATIWTYKECPEGLQGCSNNFNRFSYEVIKSSSGPLQPGNIVNETISFKPNVSGLLQCGVENEHGKSSSVADVPISDIGGNLVLRHSGERSSTEARESGGKIDIVENDEKFELLCGASTFYYKDVSLILPDDQEIQTSTTSVSIRKQVFASKVSKALGGTYRCLATGHEKPKTDFRELQINVKDEELVQFVDANVDPDGAQFVMTENDPFYINCTVSGSPTPVITWYKDNYQLLPDSDLFDGETVFLMNDMQTIFFKYLFKESIGTYSCTAENRLNERIGYLTITAPSPGLTSAAKAGLAIACIGIFFLMITVFILVKRVKKERKFRKSFRQNELYLFEKGNVGQLNPDCTADEQAELLPYDPAWEVKSDSIKIGKQLGAGAFGRVVKAVVSDLEEDRPTTTVAVKMCKSQADQSQVRALALELKIMIHLGKHLNIVNLMGANTVNIGKGELWILVEYCRFGNLLSFMHKHRQKFVNQIDPVTGNIDLTKTLPNVMTPFSPTSTTSGSRGYRSSPLTDTEGYLAPTASKFHLASPPIRKQAPDFPQSSNFFTGSTESSRSDGSSQQHMDNPMYAMLSHRPVSENPEGDPTNSALACDIHSQNEARKQRLDSVTSDIGRMQRADSVVHSDGSGKRRLQSASCSDTGSVGYHNEGGHIMNTDMTVVPLSTTSHLSPLSPTDSTHTSEYGLDSKGNPFYYDAGLIPAITAPFTTSDLVCWAWQVAQGMDYLSQRKVLHGDLAARNLLLADNNVVKISDFGLSREIYRKDVYMKKGDDLMPIKWMAVEAIRDRIFSVQSDVWAYGVTLWELFTLGSTPYPGIEVNKNFLTLLEEGYRMDRPKYANKDMYDILLHCWQSDPRNRPTFAEAANLLGDLMLADLRGQYMNMNDPYLRMNEERFQSDTDYLNMLASPNFDNLNKEDETRLHYVNVGELSDGSRDSNYLNMKSPDVVGYSRVGFNPNLHGNRGNDSTTSQSHYLPMASSQENPSPLTDVFSPRPNEDPRFTFGTDPSEKSPRLAELPEEDEGPLCIPNKDGDDLATEKSSLISTSSKNSSLDESSQKPLSSSNNHLPIQSPDHSDALYVNLPTHGVHYANLDQL